MPNLVMTCRYFRNHFQYRAWMGLLHHMIEKFILVLACVQDMLFDDKAVFRLASFLCPRNLLLFLFLLSNSALERFRNRKNKSSRNSLESEGRHSSFSCSPLAHGIPLLLVTICMGAFGLQRRHKNIQNCSSIYHSNVL